ncbi:MAG: DUF177 domain-containing protein [Thermoanaerobacteraceae bacterium]|nr:DUF177 domain-containing protein [Thermoanaerobacteraceae bacterium]
MKLNLARMKQIVGSISEFDFKEQTVNLDLEREEIKSIGPVRVKGQIENLGDRIFQVTGQIEAAANALCSRCLTATQIELTIGFALKFSDIISEAEDEEIIQFYGDEIDLYPKILEEIVLNWPSQILCKSDCKGLCPNCGANLNTTVCQCKIDNIDPRLAVLKQLLKSD